MQTKQDQKKVKNILYAKKTWLHNFDPKGQEHPGDSKATLLKYFPKYIGDIELKKTDYDGRTITKLKRAKVIHRLHSYNPEKKNQVLSRVFLANKVKSVQKFYMITNPKQIIETLRFFPAIKAVSVSEAPSFGWNQSPKSPEAVKKEIAHLYRLAQYITGMTRIDTIGISFNKKDLLGILQVLNSYRRLGDLKHLKIAFRGKNISDENILNELMSKMKNLFHYVTAFNFGELTSESFEAFKELPKKCLNLKQIHFQLSKYDHPGDNKHQVCSNYFQVLEAFQTLEIIRIGVQDMSSFVRDFTLPMSIKHMVLSFAPFGWNPEENSLMQFFEKWGKLTNLDSLDLLNYKDVVYQGQVLDFSQEILKRVPRLKKLRLNPGKIAASFAERDQVRFDIVDHFKPLNHVNLELEVLEIYAKTDLTLKDDCEKEICFPKLSRLVLSGNLFVKINLENYVRLFEGCSENIIRRIVLADNETISSNKLFSILELLKNNPSVKENLEIALDIRLGKEPGDGFLERVKDFEKDGIEMKNVLLDVQAGFARNLIPETLDKFGKMFKRFKIQ